MAINGQIFPQQQQEMEEMAITTNAVITMPVLLDNARYFNLACVTLHSAACKIKGHSPFVLLFVAIGMCMAG